MSAATADHHTRSHRQLLRDRFARRLLACAPASVLDLGCGEGELLDVCRDAGVPAVGVEPEGEQVNALTLCGHDALSSSATDLPFPDNSFGWVVIRHVLHHLEEPEATLAEAVRLARSGLLIAEPWFDVHLESQALALEFDRWLKEQDRRLGQDHFENLSSADVIHALPGGCIAALETEHYLFLRPRPQGWIEEAAKPYLEDLDDDDPARDALAEIIEKARESGISAPGTVIVTARLARS